MRLSVEEYGTVRNFTDSVSDIIMSFFESTYNKGTDRSEIFNKSFFLSQMLLDCEYQGEKCTANDFYLFHDFHYGNCFRFNGFDKKNQSFMNHNYSLYEVKYAKKSSWRNGLRLELYSGDQSSQQQFNYKIGFRVIVHNQSTFIFPDEDGIDVGVGKQTNIAVARTFTNRLARPYSDCIDDNDARSFTHSIYLMLVRNQLLAGRLRRYQQDYCVKVCYQQYIISKCNCSDPQLYYLGLSVFESVRRCSTSWEITLLRRVADEFANSDAIDECYKLCPIECKSVKYQLMISTAGKIFINNV